MQAVNCSVKKILLPVRVIAERINYESNTFGHLLAFESTWLYRLLQCCAEGGGGKHIEQMTGVILNMF